jgi:hypothetical protein
LRNPISFTKQRAKKSICNIEDTIASVPQQAWQIKQSTRKKLSRVVQFSLRAFVTNNAKLTLDASNKTVINGPFKVQLGSQLEIK